MRNRAQDERRQYTLCDKRENNYVWKNQNTVMLSEVHDKTRKQ